MERTKDVYSSERRVKATPVFSPFLMWTMSAECHKSTISLFFVKAGLEQEAPSFTYTRA